MVGLQSNVLIGRGGYCYHCHSSSSFHLVLNNMHPHNRLFHSRINAATSRQRSTFDAKKDFSLISVGCKGEDGSSDLMGPLINEVFPRLLKQGSPDAEHATTGEILTMEAADVIAFALAFDEILPLHATGKPRWRKGLSFPETFCLDQLITTSRARVRDASVTEEEILQSVTTGSELTNVGVSDVQSHWPRDTNCFRRLRRM